MLMKMRIISPRAFISPSTADAWRHEYPCARTTRPQPTYLPTNAASISWRRHRNTSRQLRLRSRAHELNVQGLITRTIAECMLSAAWKVGVISMSTKPAAFKPSLYSANARAASDAAVVGVAQRA